MAEKLFVGHWIWHDDGNGGLAVTFGSDWNEALVTKEEARAVIHAGAKKDRKWALKMSREIAEDGCSILHFCVTVDGAGKRVIDVNDCEKGCGPAASARALFAPSKGSA